jgi:hypothetical protein
VLIGIGIGLMVIGGGLGFSWYANAKQAANATTSADPTPPPTTPATDPTPAAAAAKMSVSVVTDPLDGTVQIDGDKNDKPHPTPRVFMITKDERITLRAEAKGHRSKVLTLDGATVDPHDPRLVVKLEPIAGRPGAPATPPQPAGKIAPPAKPQPTASTSPAPAAPTGLVCPPGQKPDMFGKKCETPWQ